MGKNLTRKSAYFKEIERLMSIGYEPKHIIKITGISRATVYRIVDKLRKEARIEFKDLIHKDFLYKYQMNLENYSRTVQQCNEEIEKLNKKYDELEMLNLDQLVNLTDAKSTTKANILANLTAIQSNRTNEIQKLLALRDKASDYKAKIYNQGPVVHAIDEWVRQTSPSAGQSPRLLELNAIEEENNYVEKKSLNFVPNEDDLDVLRELEEESKQLNVEEDDNFTDG